MTTIVAKTQFTSDGFDGVGGLIGHNTFGGDPWLAARGPFGTVDATQLSLGNNTSQVKGAPPSSNAALVSTLPPNADQMVGCVAVLPTTDPGSLYLLARWDDSTQTGYAMRVTRINSTQARVWLQRYAPGNNNLDLVGDGGTIIPAYSTNNFAFEVVGNKLGVYEVPSDTTYCVANDSVITQIGRVGFAFSAQAATFAAGNALNSFGGNYLQYAATGADTVYDTFTGAVSGSPIEGHIGEVGATWAWGWGGAPAGKSLLLDKGILRPATSAENPGLGNGELLVYPSGRMPPGTTKFKVEFLVRWLAVTGMSGDYGWVLVAQKGNNPGNTDTLFWIANNAIVTNTGSSSNSLPFQPAANVWYTVRLEVDGTALALFVNSIQMVAWTYANVPVEPLGFNFLDSGRLGHPLVDNVHIYYDATPVPFWKDYVETVETVAPAAREAQKSPEWQPPVATPRAVFSYMFDGFDGTGLITLHPIPNTDGVWLAARTMYGNPSATDKMTVSASFLRIVSGWEGAILFSYLPLSADQKLTASVYMPESSSFTLNLLLRWVDGATPSGYACTVSRGNGVYFHIQRFAPGNNHNDLVGTAGTIVPFTGDTFTIAMAAIGNKLSVWVNGTLAASVFDTVLPRVGMVGLDMQVFGTGVGVDVFTAESFTPSQTKYFLLDTFTGLYSDTLANHIGETGAVWTAQVDNRLVGGGSAATMLAEMGLGNIRGQGGNSTSIESNDQQIHIVTASGRPPGTDFLLTYQIVGNATVVSYFYIVFGHIAGDDMWCVKLQFTPQGSNMQITASVEMCPAGSIMAGQPSSSWVISWLGATTITYEVTGQHHLLKVLGSQSPALFDFMETGVSPPYGKVGFGMVNTPNYSLALDSIEGTWTSVGALPAFWTERVKTIELDF